MRDLILVLAILGAWVMFLAGLIELAQYKDRQDSFAAAAKEMERIEKGQAKRRALRPLLYDAELKIDSCCPCLE